MSNDDDPSPTTPGGRNVSQPSPAPNRSFFEIPPAVKRIFDKFPLVTYADNDLPLRAPQRSRDGHALYVFTTAEDARNGRPSYNPGCLKWQTYLRLSGIEHRIVASTNHASPSGALPFLLPSEQSATAAPVTANRLKRWITAQQRADKTKEELEPTDVRYQAYQALLDSRIRIAWLYQLYLNPSNASLLHKLYVAPCSTNPFVQMTIAHQLRQAAETEITKATGSSIIIEEDIMHDAEEAMAALSTLLGSGKWIFGQDVPGLFDASVFAYTHLLLGDRLAFAENQMGEMAKRYENLVQHQNRIVEMYY